MFRAIPAAVVVLLLAAPGMAQARTFKGRSSQGRTVTVVADSRGEIEHMTVYWNASCKHGTAKNGTIFRPYVGHVVNDGIAVDVAYDVKQTNGYTSHITAVLRGVTAGKGYRGTLQVTLTARRHGKKVDTCHSGALTWSAGTPDPPGPVKHFVGWGKQRRIATLQTAPDGTPAAVRVSFAAKCGDHSRLYDTTVFIPPLDTLTTDSVADAGTYREKGVRGERWTLTVSMAGRRVLDPAHPEGEHWSGTFSAKVVVKKGSRHATTCTVKNTTWRANLM
jgi:hypothetical protein